MIIIFLGLELKNGSYSFYDSFVYPQLPKGIRERVMSREFLSATFKEPEWMNEAELCFEMYLGEEFGRINSQHYVLDDVMALYRKLVRVNDSLKYLKKVNIENTTDERMLLRFTGKTFEMVS